MSGLAEKLYSERIREVCSTRRRRYAEALLEIEVRKFYTLNK